MKLDMKNYYGKFMYQRIYAQQISMKMTFRALFGILLHILIYCSHSSSIISKKESQMGSNEAKSMVGSLRDQINTLKAENHKLESIIHHNNGRWMRKDMNEKLPVC